MSTSTFKVWLSGAGGLVALLVAAMALSLHNTRELNDDAAWVVHTEQVLEALEQARGHLQEAATVQRSYIITGGDVLPPGFAPAIGAAKLALGNVKALTVDNPGQQARISAIESLTSKAATALEHAMKVRKERGFDTAKKMMLAGQSSVSTAELQHQLEEMSNAERVFLFERTAKTGQTYRLAVVTDLVSGIAAVAAVIAFVMLLGRHLAARAASAAVVAEQGERLRTTLASIGDAVITTDTKARIVGMNPAAEALTGWTHKEADGLPIEAVFQIVDERTRQGVGDLAAKALTAGAVVGSANPTVLIAKNGAERLIEDSAAPIRCKEGKLVGCVLVFRDVTDRRREERKRLEQEREAKEQERFLLAEADRRKDEFLAILSHEMRNPLASMHNAVQIIRLSPDPATREQARAMMERQLGQMTRLVDDLLDISRIATGKLELRKERVPLSTIVTRAVEMNRPLIDQMEHQLIVNLPEQPVVVEADVTRLAQVLGNLLNNSAKYTDRGGHIRLTAERQGNEVVLSVKDTGIGITADQLPRLFEMFSQAEGARQRSQGGLGIGLTLLKRLVDLHQGTVQAKSEGPGKGSEFVVRLPIVAET